MLQYTLRVRDLVHGTILFTETEEKIINHPLFQRLRQIRQNDVAFFVYPSLNTSRFEHTLGTCRVAGMMAENLTKGPKWKVYFRELKAETGIASKAQFIELSRLYALLHDVGHLPLSHLFEMAVASWAGKPQREQEIIKEWSGVSGFEMLHEALGAMIVRRMVQDLNLLKSVRNALVTLMTEKVPPPTHPFSVVKALMDSQIDADRIDSTQRDGFLAGGEYGHYDIRRLCDSVFLEQREGRWIVGYSEKALTSMEALLLDRYRTHVWIHFHHRVVAMKMLVGFLIEQALAQKLITKDHFDPKETDAFALRDDVWLWNVLRGMPTAGDRTLAMVKRAVFYREKQNALNLWKTRPAYHALWDKVKDEADVTEIQLGNIASYREYLGKKIGARTLIFRVPFKPLSEKAILLYSEADKKLTGKNLLEASRLIAELEAIWKDEPQEFILLVGKNVRARARRMSDRWVDLTADWIHTPHLFR